MTAPRNDDDEALAAEYVIGVLPAEDRKAAEQRMGREAGFAARVARWEARLEALNDEYGSLAPPARVKRAIDKRLFAAPRRNWWGWLGGLGVIAAGLALVAMLGLFTPAGPDLRATLEGESPAYRFDVALETDRLDITLARGAPAAPQVFELWLVPESGIPQSLGVFTAGAATSLRRPETLGAGTTLAVSLEPPGGAPGGVATGPVVAIGTLALTR